ncbi:MAG: hypothetical protein ABI175_16360 [Polyangiales bacterium]
MVILRQSLAVWFADQRRFRSPAVTRAFASTMRAVALGTPQSEVSQPYDVTLVEIADS